MSWRILSSAWFSAPVLRDELVDRGDRGLAAGDLQLLRLDLLAEPVWQQDRVGRGFGKPGPGLRFASQLRPPAFRRFQLRGVAQLLFEEPHQPVKQGASRRHVLEGDARRRVGHGRIAEGLGGGQIGAGFSKSPLEGLDRCGGSLGVAYRGTLLGLRSERRDGQHGRQQCESEKS